MFEFFQISHALFFSVSVCSSKLLQGHAVLILGNIHDIYKMHNMTVPANNNTIRFSSSASFVASVLKKRNVDA